MRYFKIEEFACKCTYPDCDAPVMDPDFLMKADAMRGLWGKHLVCNSGARCLRHNADVGGAKDSEHTRGQAGDFRTANREESVELAKVAEVVGFTGIGIYETWVHCDIGMKRRWVR
jgi:zinc D-Ala-D-Ala carboxypeptidase